MHGLYDGAVGSIGSRTPERIVDRLPPYLAAADPACHLAHASGPERADDFVGTKTRTGGEWQRVPILPPDREIKRASCRRVTAAN